MAAETTTVPRVVPGGMGCALAQTELPPIGSHWPICIHAHASVAEAANAAGTCPDIYRDSHIGACAHTQRHEHSHTHTHTHIHTCACTAPQAGGRVGCGPHESVQLDAKERVLSKRACLVVGRPRHHRRRLRRRGNAEDGESEAVERKRGALGYDPRPVTQRTHTRGRAHAVDGCLFVCVYVCVYE
jgi:hypothetical protein